MLNGNPTQAQSHANRTGTHRWSQVQSLHGETHTRCTWRATGQELMHGVHIPPSCLKVVTRRHFGVASTTSTYSSHYSKPLQRWSVLPIQRRLVVHHQMCPETLAEFIFEHQSSSPTLQYHAAMGKCLSTPDHPLSDSQHTSPNPRRFFSCPAMPGGLQALPTHHQ